MIVHTSVKVGIARFLKALRFLSEGFFLRPAFPGAPRRTFGGVLQRLWDSLSVAAGEVCLSRCENCLTGGPAAGDRSVNLTVT